MTNAGEELLDLVEVGVTVPDVDQVVLAGQFHELGAGDVLGQIHRVRLSGEAVASAVQYECRRLDGGKQWPHVGEHQHLGRFLTAAGP